MGNIAEQIGAGNVPPIADYPELADVLAIQAREIHYKRECLTAEWEGNGWQVLPGTSSEAQLYQADLTAISESILGVRSRTLGTAPSRATAATRTPKALANYQIGGEPGGPIEAARFTRWDMEARLGDADFLSDPQWWAAYHLEHGGHTQAAQLQGLLRLKWANPDQWQEWREWAAMKAVALGLPETPEGMPTIPQLPTSPRLMAKVELLSQCPGIQQVLDGTMSRWSQASPEVMEAHQWAIENSQQLAAMSSHNQRNNGYQFTPKTYPVAAFSKLLAMVGIETACTGQAARVRNYRRKTATDIQQAIAKAQEKGRNEASLQRQLYRAQHQDEVIGAAQAAAVTATEASAASWASWAAWAAQNFSDEITPTEVLCSPHLTPGDTVRRAGLLGWRGVIVAIESGTQALVHWFGDPEPSLASINGLEMAA
jgi:hypothetical protein